MNKTADANGAVVHRAAPEERKINWPRLAEAYALPGALVLIGSVFGVLRPEAFLSWANISTMLGSQAVLVVLTLALIIPLTAGDFDLSVASVLTLSAMLLAVLNAQMGIPIGWAMLCSFAVAVVVGLVNAGFILYFRIPSLIVTLGTGTFVNGIVLWISSSMTISGIDPVLIKYVIVTRVLGVPIVFYYAVAVCFVVWYTFEYTAHGRRLIFVGRGREVARLSGIKVDSVRLVCLVVSSVMSAAAGIFYAGTIGAADPLSGQTFLLPAFAAAFLGATAISPGRFNAWGSLVAVYFLVTGITGLTILGIQTYVQNLFYGAALVLAVALSQLVRKREVQEFS